MPLLVCIYSLRCFYLLVIFFRSVSYTNHAKKIPERENEVERSKLRTWDGWEEKRKKSKKWKKEKQNKAIVVLSTT